MELTFATTNKYKIASAQRRLDKYHIKVIGKGVEVAEIQADSVEEVITDKVKKCYDQLKEPLVAMDSGLFIESLKGFPGIYTRYVINSIGEDGLIRLISHLDHPKAYVQRTIAYTDGREVKIFKSKGEGEIIQEKRGSNGANYDFIFYVPKIAKTLAEMTTDEQDIVWGDAWDQVGKFIKDQKEQVGGFRCSHCNKRVFVGKFMGTANRNHCPFCLWSKHVDFNNSGDRKSVCEAGMKPIGLTFKQEGWDKWGKPKQGEVMVIHKCTQGDKISINRIAGDDDPKLILKLFHESQCIDEETQKQLMDGGIDLLTAKDEEEIRKQLHGISTVVEKLLEQL